MFAQLHSQKQHFDTSVFEVLHPVCLKLVPKTLRYCAHRLAEAFIPIMYKAFVCSHGNNNVGHKSEWP